MHSEEFTVLNIKCGGCANSIRTGLKDLPGIDSIDVNIEQGTVILNGTSIDRNTISSKLEKLGFPEA